MKIKELEVNSSYTVTLVVKSAVAKTTRAGKPYLALEFFDGVDTINGNYWDWSSGKVPEVNTILDVTVTVTEWQGTKQLNVTRMQNNTTDKLTEFMPSSRYDISEVFNDAVTLAESITDESLRKLTIALLIELRHKWEVVPGAVSVHHAYVGGNLVHSYNVAIKAMALAEVTEGADVDLAIAGGLLHDIGKLYTYTMNGVVIDRTTDGNLYEHIFIGAEFVGNFAESHLDIYNYGIHSKIRLLRHIILSHHGTLEFGSPVTPQCIEAYIVHYADALDATNEQIISAKSGDTWTDKIWTLSNRPHLTHKYVQRIMEKENDEVTTPIS